MKFYFKQIVPDRIGAGLGILLAAAYALGWLGGPALADDITWTNPSQLAEEPSEGGQGFFPGTSLTGNTVTVNSGPDLIGGVYGAVTGGDEAVRHNQVFVSGTANITEGVAGAVSGGEASENYAEISGGEFDALAGGLSMRSRADNNEILMTGGRVLGPEGIAGGLALGFSGQGGVSGNKVTFGGTAYSASYLLSGYVRNGSGNAEKNSLIINGGTVGTSAGYFHGAYGGMVEQPDSAGSALSNEVLMTGGTIFGHLFGGAALGEGRAEANQVTMTGGLLNSSDRGSSLYGGFAMSGDALRNKVYFEGGQVLGDEDSFAGGAIGGFSYGGAVRGNEVYVSGGELEWAPAGGITMGAAPAEDNSVTVSGGNMTVIIGGFSMGGDASGNSITLTGGNVSESLASGLTVTGAVHHNQVLVTGGNLGFGVPDGGIAGGLSMYGGENYANTVTVTGGTIKGAVSGGMMQFDGAAHDNTVTISGAPDLTGASLYGGYYEGPPPFTGDLFSGNTLNVWGYSGTAILEAGNFETYNFLLPRIQPSAPLLEASGTVV
ncbi:MAG: hypothetical protein LBK52_05745, partial [Deltaproteobacteria bacterium]|nr:hypothetical protein [Deltaproteobacteria bacterium]